MEASCWCGNAQESCGVCNTNKGYLLLLSHMVASVASPDLRCGGEAVQVAVCCSLGFGSRAGVSVAAVIDVPWNSSCAAVNAVLELSLHHLGAQASEASPTLAATFAASLAPLCWSSKRNPKRDQVMT